MKLKYSFFKDRLRELNKTQTEMADYIGTTQAKLNKTLNHPHLRELQQSEISKTAEFLRYDLSDFTKYVSGETTNIPHTIDDFDITESSSNPLSKSIDDPARLFNILNTINIELNKRKVIAPDIEKFNFAVFLYHDGAGKNNDTMANDNEIINAVKIAFRAA